MSKTASSSISGLDRTALSLAACGGNAEVVRLLLEQNDIELNLRDCDGQTALVLAAYREHAEVVKLLLGQNRVEPNLKDKYCRTALLCAASNGHGEVIKLLLGYHRRTSNSISRIRIIEQRFHGPQVKGMLM